MTLAEVLICGADGAWSSARFVGGDDENDLDGEK